MDGFPIALLFWNFQSDLSEVEMKNTKQIVVFGSKLWPGCEIVKEQLNEAGIRYIYASITDSLSNLKVFMDYRESLPVFDSIKERGSIGIPFIVVNKGERYFFEDDFNLDDLK